MSLFSIPRNKRFVFVNADVTVQSDPLINAIDFLMQTIERAASKEKADDDLDDIRPFKGFAKPLNCYGNENSAAWMNVNGNNSPKVEHRFITLLQDHVNEAIEDGFDDSVAKFKGKSHFVVSGIFLSQIGQIKLLLIFVDT